MGLAANTGAMNSIGNAVQGMWNNSYTTQPGFTNTPNYLVR